MLIYNIVYKGKLDSEVSYNHNEDEQLNHYPIGRRESWNCFYEL